MPQSINGVVSHAYLHVYSLVLDMGLEVRSLVATILPRNIMMDDCLPLRRRTTLSLPVQALFIVERPEAHMTLNVGHRKGRLDKPGTAENPIY